MKITIEIEKFDNGITLKWKDVGGKQDPQANVALDSNKEIAIGRMIWDDVKMIMDSTSCNAVEMEIEYKPIKK